MFVQNSFNGTEWWITVDHIIVCHSFCHIPRLLFKYIAMQMLRILYLSIFWDIFTFSSFIHDWISLMHDLEIYKKTVNFLQRNICIKIVIKRCILKLQLPFYVPFCKQKRFKRIKLCLMVRGRLATMASSRPPRILPFLTRFWIYKQLS